MRTIFIGGGTPTLLAADLWGELLDCLEGWRDASGGTEFTVEANPETVTPQLVETLASGGVNRVSIGAQSFNQTHLKTLERWHEIENVAGAVDMLRSGGITNINLDLIFGIPGQSVDQWRSDLERAIGIGPMHMSCYSLTYEQGTAMTARLEAGQFERADEDVEAEMFEVTRTVLGEAGYEAYEVSNFAQPGFECRHNLVYWHGGDYLAAGPSAAGHVDGVRWKNAPHLGEYLASTVDVPVAEVEELDARTQLAERLMLGLRLMEGLDARALDATARAIGEAMHERLSRALQRAQSSGDVEERDGRWVLTQRGLMMGDRVLGELMFVVRGEVRVHG